MTEAKKTILFVSICLAVIIAGVVFMQGRKPPSVEIVDRMAALQAAIEDWHAEKGAPPESLQVLGLPEEEIQDIVLKPFVYSVSEDGSTVTLSTLGADEKVGGKMFNADRELIFTLGSDAKENEPAP
ncbi:MAG: hypothetical protein AAF236_09205 [Verrucomicrobiota bacterium]